MEGASVEMGAVGASKNPRRARRRGGTGAPKRKTRRRSLAQLSHAGSGSGVAGDGTGVASPRVTALDEAMGIPVREGLQSLHRIVRYKTIRDFSIFAVFLMLYAFITLNVIDVHQAWSTDAAVEDLFLDEEFGPVYKKNFYEVMTMGEFWDWMEGPLLNGLYPTEWYNGDEFTPGEQGYVLEYLRLVGGVQIRQARVTNNSCFERRATEFCNMRDGVCQGKFDTKSGTCYAEFSSSTQATAPFGPPEDPSRYTWRDGLSRLEGLWGFGYDYGTGAYVTELPLNKTRATELVAQMKADKWTDQSTRSVTVNFNLYNTNTKLLTVARVVFEVDFTGNFIIFAKLYTLKLVVYGWKGTTIYDYSDVFRAVCEMMYLGLLFFFLQKEARRLFWTKPRIAYFSKAKNLTEVVLLVTNALLISMWLSVLLDPRRLDFTVNSPAFVDMFTLGQRYVNAFTAAGVLGLMYSLKLFRYLAINKKMATMWETLYRASGDLAAFLVGFTAIALGFAIFGQYSFGYLLVQFHNMPASFSTVLRFSLGDFEYDELTLARPRLAGIYFTMYVAIVFFVMINIIIGIVTKFFDEVHEETKTADRWKRSAKNFEADVLQRCTRWSRRWCAPCSRQCNRNVSAAEYAAQERMRDELEKGFDREMAFLRQLRHCMRVGKRVSRVDLYQHLNNIYKNDPARNLYLGVHELCQITKKPPCKPNEHVACDAVILVQLYNDLKEVSMMGEAEQHESKSQFASSDNRKFPVVKINKYGRKQNRIISVDPVTGNLMNYDRHTRLHRRLPLEQLVQIDQDRTDPRRLDLQFTSDTSQSASILAMKDEEARQHAIESRADLETHYTLLFTNQVSRGEFLADLLHALDHPGEVADPGKPRALSRSLTGLERTIHDSAPAGSGEGSTAEAARVMATLTQLSHKVDGLRSQQPSSPSTARPPPRSAR